ncbi:MAG: helix-turn-helix transcriptional regulator [Planctomycetota bacterium]|nr:helix-turn-helix transcriptional regulator [Planctomycetota bacterium]
MVRRQAKHVRRDLTDAERARVSEARRLVQEEEAEIRSKAKKYKQEYDAAQVALRDALELLKAERMRQDLSLADMQERTGIERPNLSRLESDAEVNPTVATLTRYAEALGKKIVISLSDLAAP